MQLHWVKNSTRGCQDESAQELTSNIKDANRLITETIFLQNRKGMNEDNNKVIDIRKQAIEFCSFSEYVQTYQKSRGQSLQILGKYMEKATIRKQKLNWSSSW